MWSRGWQARYTDFCGVIEPNLSDSCTQGKRIRARRLTPTDSSLSGLGSRKLGLRCPLFNCLAWLAILFLVACTCTEPTLSEESGCGTREPAELERGACRATESCINDIALSPAGDYLAVASWQGLIVYRTDTFEKVCSAFGKSLGDLAFAPDGTMLASIVFKDREAEEASAGQGEGGTDTPVTTQGKPTPFPTIPPTVPVVLWDTGQCRPLYEWQGKNQSFFESTSLAWSPDGKWLISGRFNDVLFLRNETGELLQTIDQSPESSFDFFGTGGPPPQWDVAWSPDGTQLAFGVHNTERVVVVDASTGSLVHALEGHPNFWIVGVAFSPGGTKLASMSLDGTVILWDVESGQQLWTVKIENGGSGGVAWSPDGRKLASGTYSGTVMILNAETGELERALEGHTDEIIYKIDFYSQGKMLVSASQNEIIAWDIETGKQIHVINELPGE
jgi:WD40 repeat protein